MFIEVIKIVKLLVEIVIGEKIPLDEELSITIRRLERYKEKRNEN